MSKKIEVVLENWPSEAEARVFAKWLTEVGLLLFQVDCRRELEALEQPVEKATTITTTFNEHDYLRLRGMGVQL